MMQNFNFPALKDMDSSLWRKAVRMGFENGLIKLAETNSHEIVCTIGGFSFPFSDLTLDYQHEGGLQEFSERCPKLLIVDEITKTIVRMNAHTEATPDAEYQYYYNCLIANKSCTP